METNKNQRLEWGVLFGLFAAGFAIRTIGVDHGAVLGDERIGEAAKVLTGKLVPDHHFYPPLLSYLTAVIYGVMFAIGKLVGIWPDTASFRAQYFVDPTIFNVSGRLLVAAFAALMAPIGFWFARCLGYSRLSSLLVAVVLLLASISVYLSYIFKGDPAMATFSLLSVALVVRKVQVPKSVWLDVWLGISLVLALSFKHSFVFLMGPLAIAYGFGAWPVMALRGLVTSYLRIILTVCLTWPILNIGIVLDFQNFLSFQKIQSVMSLTEGASLTDAIILMVERMIHWQSGVGLPLALLFVGFPLVVRRTSQTRILMAVWVAVIVGIVLVAHLVRLRQPEHLWISFFVLVALFGALTLIELTRMVKTVGGLVVAVTLGTLLLGCIGVWQQTLARPMTLDIADVLEERFAERRVVTGIPLPGIKQSRDAQDYEMARLQRTADKYQVWLPPLSPERIISLDAADTRFILPLPNPMYGLEDAKDEDLIGNIQAYAWPPQVEDWTLDTWLADGVEVFVVANLAHSAQSSRSELLRAFYQELENRCDVAARFAPRKPLFLERETVILDCASAR